MYSILLSLLINNKNIIKSSSKKGIFFAVEGPDGSGKSTLIENLKLYFEKMGLNVGVFKNHAGQLSPYWQSVKVTKNQLAEKNLFLSHEIERALQTFEFLAYCRSTLPIMLDNCDIVIADRYILSKIIHGRLAFKYKTEAENLLLVANDIPIPEKTFFIDISAETAMERIVKRGKECDWKENARMISKVINLYGEYLPNISNLCRLDGSLSPEDLVNEVVKLSKNSVMGFV